MRHTLLDEKILVNYDLPNSACNYEIPPNAYASAGLDICGVVLHLHPVAYAAMAQAEWGISLRGVRLKWTPSHLLHPAYSN